MGHGRTTKQTAALGRGSLNRDEVRARIAEPQAEAEQHYRQSIMANAIQRLAAKLLSWAERTCTWLNLKIASPSRRALQTQSDEI
jgi:hypothetical protein